MGHGLQGRQIAIPSELEPIRVAALQALGNIRPANGKARDNTGPDRTWVLTKAGEDLPPYYLIYFLFVDLLGFPNYGRAEKVAWGIPFDYEGNAFLIAHHKFGIRLTAQESPTTEAEAAEVVCLIRKGVNKAEPFFRWLADRAVSGSALNVVNRSRNLFERFEFYLEEYKKKVGQANAESDEGFQIPRVYTKLSDFYLPPYKRWLESGWLGLAVIDAFFSWTEHIFIHLAILKGHLTTGAQVAELAKGDWSKKFKEALDLANPETKKYYDGLADIRCQFRNFNTHGAFGKQGEAFSFHSDVGAVPVRFTHEPQHPNFRFGRGDEIPEGKAIEVIENFIDYLWNSECAPAYSYIQESDLPTLLTYASDGTYTQALMSVDAMEALVKRLTSEWERAANMDW